MSVQPACILVVDDEPAIRRYVAEVLGGAGHRCVEACSVADALSCVEAEQPELVVTDVVMPGGSGHSLVRLLRERHPEVATVMLTGRDDDDAVDRALDGGVYGYVVKPFRPRELEIAVEGALLRRLAALESRAHREQLEALVRRRTLELEESRAETVERLARAIESHDTGTGSHIQRMSGLVEQLALELGWSEQGAETLRLASVLHDVGKVSIPEGILGKAGPLEPEERRQVEAHAAAGHGILAGARSDLLRTADAIAWTHHERYDGSGYPRGLAGADIPLAGRIAAVADVFDALTSDRPYRSALGEFEALAEMHAGHDRLFDRNVLAALERVLARRRTGDRIPADGGR